MSTIIVSSSALPISTFFLPATISYASYASSATQACYLHNGTDRNSQIDGGSGTYQACASGQSGSMCCRSTGDTCLENGLCWSSGANAFWRESCTDQEWKSSSCLNLCLDVAGPNTSDVQVTQCQDGSYCCGGQNTTCCASKSGYKISAFNGVYQVEHADGSPITSTTTTGPTSTSTSPSGGIITTPAKITTPDSGGTNTGAIAGGVVGGVALLALIAGILFFLYRRRRRTNDNARIGIIAVANGRSELETKEKRGEFQTVERPGELGADRGGIELSSEGRGPQGLAELPSDSRTLQNR